MTNNDFKRDKLNRANCRLSDAVQIEVIHAVRDILVSLINSFATRGATAE